MSSPRPLLLSSLLLAGFTLACSTALSAAEYSLIEIPAPLNHAVGLNNRGDVVGDAGPGSPGPSPSGALVYHGITGVLTLLPCQGTSGCSSVATGVNDHGDVVGTNNSSVGAPPNAAIWLSNGGVTVLENTFSFGVGINNQGQAVGNSYDFHGDQSGFVTDSLGQTHLTLIWLIQCGFGFCGAQTGGAAINDLGHAVGWSDWGAEPPSEPGAGQAWSGIHAVMWVNGSPTDLGALGNHTYASAHSVNNLDAVVGNSTVGAASHAFLYRNGSMGDLGNLPGEPQLNSDALDINDQGEIVGWSDVRLDADHSITQRAFVMKNGQMQNLTFLLDPQVWARIRLTEATSIDCHGLIAANGYEAASGAKHAYLLVPNKPLQVECPQSRAAPAVLAK